MKILVIQCLHIVYLMLQKINQIVTEAKTAWKGFAKTQKNIQQKQLTMEKRNNTINQ